MFNRWLLQFLTEHGLPADATLIVHSAFRLLSQQGVRAESVCQTLLQALAAGTLCMPTMTWRTVHAGQPVFDSRLTPSHTGVLTEVFRQQFASHRSLHPTHSVAMAGRHALELTASHHLSTTPCSVNSPYGLLNSSVLLDNAYILLLGVGLESCTFIHHFEELYAPNLYLDAGFTDYQLIDEHGGTHLFQLRKHSKQTRDFHQFGAPLVQQQAMFYGQFAGCDVLLVRAAPLAAVVSRQLQADPAGTLIRHSYWRGQSTAGVAN